MPDRSGRDVRPGLTVVPLHMHLGHSPTTRDRPPPIPQSWAHAIDAWALFAREDGKARSSISTRREHLEHCARRVRVDDPWAVTGDQLVDYFDAQDWRRETRRGHRASLRAFYGWAADEGHVERSPALLLPKVKPGLPRPRPLPDEGYWLAARAADPRELLMLRLGVELGLRRMEIAQAHTRDLIEDLAGWSLLVHGKGDRERILPVPDELAIVLRSLPRGWFFPGDDHGHLSPRWVGTLIGRLLPPGYTTHTLRHAFATSTHDDCGDLLQVQRLLGHASVATTQAYVLVRDDRLRDTVNRAARSRVGPRRVA